jgi:hypothetical protein
MDLWATSLVAAGVPEGKVFSHIALSPQIQSGSSAGSYLQSIHFTPPSIAYGAHRLAGYSTYPGTAQPQQIDAQYVAHGYQPWASMEGTALDPGQAKDGTMGESMEFYLGNLFNHGAVLVNIFGWGLGEANNAFQLTAENQTSLAAYRKFLSGAQLMDGPVSLQEKIALIQAKVSAWVQAHPDQQSTMTTLLQQLTQYVQTGDMTNANKTANTILQKIGALSSSTTTTTTNTTTTNTNTNTTSNTNTNTTTNTDTTINTYTVTTTSSSCNFNGKSVAGGSSVTAYQTSSAPYGSTCISQQRTCSNGVLSGSYPFASCTVAGPASCKFGSWTILNGQSVAAYLNAVEGDTCHEQLRTCTNGTLSGTYINASCSVVN